MSCSTQDRGSPNITMKNIKWHHSSGIRSSKLKGKLTNFLSGQVGKKCELRVLLQAINLLEKRESKTGSFR